MTAFPTNQEFLDAEKSDIIKWREVSQGIIYKKIDLEQMITQKREATVVSLTSEEVLINDLKDFDAIKDYYIKSLGLKIIKKNPNQSYYRNSLLGSSKKA